MQKAKRWNLKIAIESANLTYAQLGKHVNRSQWWVVKVVAGTIDASPQQRRCIAATLKQSESLLFDEKVNIQRSGRAA